MRATVSLSRTGHLLLFLIGLLLALQFVVPSRAWTLLFIVLGGAMACSYGWARQHAQRLTLTRQQRYGWVHVGDLMEGTFCVTNHSPFPVLWVAVGDESDLPGYTASTVRATGGHLTLTWRVEGTCTRRGLFTLGPWQARLSDPIGWYEVVHEFPDTRSILVYPPVVRLPSLHLPRGASAGAGRTSRRASEITPSAAGVRAYAHGDSLNRVHWRVTAHRGELMVKEFDLVPSGDLWIILDLEASVQAGKGEESTEEYGVILAASLAHRMLAANRAVGLVASGQQRNFLLPQRGQSCRWRILQTLAAAKADGQAPLGQVLLEMDRNLGRGATLAVITPNRTPDWLAGLLPPMRRGIASSAILLDPVSFGSRLQGRRPATPQGNVSALQGLLAEQGVPSFVITQGTAFRAVARHGRIGRPEYKLLPGTGRVIPVARRDRAGGSQRGGAAMRWLLRLLRRQAARGGWFVYLLTLSLLACAPPALGQANPEQGAGRLIPPTLLARVVDRLVLPLSQWLSDICYALAWLRALQSGVLIRPLPFAEVAGFAWQRIADLTTRLVWWGGRGCDPLALIVGAGLMAWAAAAVTTWLLYRRRQGLAGLLLPGLATAEVVFLTGQGADWLAVFAAGTLALTAAFHVAEAERRWQVSGIDYPEDVRLDLSFIVGLFVAVLVLPAAVFPVERLKPVTEALWGALDGSRQGIEGPAQLSGLLPGPTAFESSALPSRQQIGTGPELSEKPVFRVRTHAPTPLSAEEAPPRHYWRNATLDEYTGHGWASSPATACILPAEQPLERYPAERSACFSSSSGSPPAHPAYMRPMRQNGSTNRSQSGSGRPATWCRSLPHLGGTRLSHGHPPPTWRSFVPPRSRCQLPESLPARERALAERIAGEAETPLDQALRLEVFPQAVPYALDLPDPPAEQDVADYFLFDLQWGYCDYYATAMVVMARAVGLPARLVTGFAPGTLVPAPHLSVPHRHGQVQAFDPETGTYLITQAEARAWAEVYFAGMGWLEFEPTAGRPGLVRPTAMAEEPLQSLPSIPPRSHRPFPWVALLAVGVAAAVLAIGVLLWHRWRVDMPAALRSTASAVVDRFGRLLRWGERLGHPLIDGQTPAEYAAGLGRSLVARAEQSRLGRIRQRARTAQREDELLGAEFARARHVPQPVTAREGEQVQRMWECLRRWLWELWVAGSWLGG